jgi:hypothetical protein
MEYCKGGDLSNYMKKNKTISEEKSKIFLSDLSYNFFNY